MWGTQRTAFKTRWGVQKTDEQAVWFQHEGATIGKPNMRGSKAKPHCGDKEKLRDGVESVSHPSGYLKYEFFPKCIKYCLEMYLFARHFYSEF